MTELGLNLHFLNLFLSKGLSTVLHYFIEMLVLKEYGGAC